MARNGDWFELHVPGATAGARYKFKIDDDIEIADPASQFQPDDVQGASEVIDHRYDWQTRDWKGLPWEQAVFLETHVGTFTPQGTFRAMIDRLDHLVETGITALELMPLADFPGRWNWGYDGVLLVCAGFHLWPAGRPEGADRRRACARADGVSRRRLQSLRPGRKLSRPHRAGLLLGCAYAVGRRHQLRAAGGARLRHRECTALAARLPLRRTAPRRRTRHRHAGRSPFVDRTEPGRRANSLSKPAGIFISCWKTTTTKPSAWRPTRARQTAAIARNGTTTITTPGTCSSLARRPATTAITTTPRLTLRAPWPKASPIRASRLPHRDGLLRGEPSGGLPSIGFCQFPAKPRPDRQPSFRRTSVVAGHAGRRCRLLLPCCCCSHRRRCCSWAKNGARRSLSVLLRFQRRPGASGPRRPQEGIRRRLC